MDALNHFRCPLCGTLTSSDFSDVAYCHHRNGNFSYSQPDFHPFAFQDPEDGPSYSRMARVISVEVEPVYEPEKWYVVESRNPYGYDDDEVIVTKGNGREFVDGDESWRLATTDFFATQDAAEARAITLARIAKMEERARRGKPYPDHTHSFIVKPDDQVAKLTTGAR